MSDAHTSPETVEALALADKLANLPMYYHDREPAPRAPYVEISDDMRVDLCSALRGAAQASPSSEAVRSLVWLVEHGTNDDLVAARGRILERLRGDAQIPPRQSYDVAFHENQIDKLDALKAVERGEFTDLPPLADSRRVPAQAPPVRGVSEKTECGQWIDQTYQIDRYGVALMMIGAGCADPAGLARRILSEFGCTVSRPDRGDAT